MPTYLFKGCEMKRLLRRAQLLIASIFGCLLQAYYGEVDAEYVSNYSFILAKERYTGNFDYGIQTMFRQARDVSSLQLRL